MIFNDDPTQGSVYHVYITDGTTTTSLTANGVNPQWFATLGNFTYFQGTDSHGAELWRTDGSAGNTGLFADVVSGSNGSQPIYLTASGSHLFVQASNSGFTSVDLWATDGTSAPIDLVANVGTGETTNPMIDINGTLYFGAQDGGNGYQLWKSDGAPGGTTKVSTTDFISMGEFENINGTLYFGVQVAFDPATNDHNAKELWKTTGNGTGVTEVTDRFAFFDAAPQAPYTYIISGTATGDFNSDHSSDLLWRQSGGTFTEWQSTGPGFTPNVVVNSTVGNAWHSEGTFDFSGDGQADVLWRNDASGQFTIWNSTGSGFTPNSYASNGVDTAWKVAALADFNGDGMSDMLFRHTNGTFTEWQSTGSGFTPNVTVNTTVDNTWHLAGAADFSGDGKADLLWRAANGQFTEWQSTGNGFTPNVVNNSTVDSTWHVLATGDFNGDGKADLLFRHNNGTFTEWQSTGSGFDLSPNVHPAIGRIL